MAFEPFIHFMRGLQGKISSNGMGGMQGQNSHHIAFLRQLQKELNLETQMKVPLHELNVVVFDIETTGFFPDKGDEIISIGAVKVTNGNINKEDIFYSLAHCEKDLSKELVHLTGITNDQLKTAPPLSEVLVNFFNFAKNNTLIAHHANHEKSFLQNACWKLYRSPFKHRIVDTSFLYRIAEPDLRLVSLEEICEHNGIPIKDRHHALGDAKLTAELWCKYIAKVQAIGCNTLTDVYERLARL
ncbi:exonuclease domain-containing protein [Cytobacillus sp. FJAT-54145]|uniref:Exonuclease domain-containing protein n=1 Tax=Cytobacillus spartinae TaxID=3299023 RepID=A0ABW6K806_9BACI